MSLNSRKIIPAVATALLALVALPGCFTGVERTPVIKDSTSKSSTKTKHSDEQLLMASVVPEPPAEWKLGKPFLVSEGRLDYAYSPLTIVRTLSAGDTLRFAGFRGAVRLSGDSITEIVLTTPLNDEVTYRIESPLSQIVKGSTLSIPFTNDLDLVNEAKYVLKGKHVWTLKPNSQGRKYQPSVISDILPGNSDYPFRVVISPDTLLMVANSGSSATSRTFANLFTLSDPRKLHPDISDKNWELVAQGKVALDMTREECRLAIGSPAQVERNTLPSGIIERWIYEDGVYLIFTDGILTNFRQ